MMTPSTDHLLGAVREEIRRGMVSRRLVCIATLTGLCSLPGRLVPALGHRTAATPGDLKPRLVLQLGHDYSVRAVAFAPDGATLASAGNDGRIKVWDARSGTLQQTFEPAEFGVYGITGMAYLPDGATLVMAGTW